MVKLNLNYLDLMLTATGHGSTVHADGVDISKMVEKVQVETSTGRGTRVELKMVLADCRVSGKGVILAPHPNSGELLEVAEIRFKNGDRWKVVPESSES